MKVIKIVLTLLLCGASVLGLSCAAKSSSAQAQEEQIATVQRGDLTINITASGNLALSRTADLAFEMAGTVAEVGVKEGDTVKEGQVLAKLDVSDWEDTLKTLDKALVAAQRSLTTKEPALTKAEYNVTTKEIALTKAERQVTAKESAVAKAERQVTTKELALRQAQLDLQSAENSLKEVAAVKAIQDQIDNAKDLLKFARLVLAGQGQLSAVDFTYWSGLEAYARDTLTHAQQDLKDILEGSSVKVSADMALQVAKGQLAVEQCQLKLKDAQVAVEDAKQAVEDAKLDLEDAKQAVKDAQLALKNAKQAVEDAKLDIKDAKQAVEDAQSRLDEAKSASPLIKAPFDGFVTKVNTVGVQALQGAEVKKGTVAMQIADLNQFKADILVSEMDISKVRLGGEAQVQPTAVSTLNLPAKVTYIAPTATAQQGVVNYKVTVELQSLQPVSPRSQSGQSQRPQSVPSTPAAAAPTQAIQLREGLSVTVNILVQEKKDVLLVPNRAITRQGRETVVKVTKSGIAEVRPIKTGISDWQYTEVTEGLSEGEQVIVPKATTTTGTSTQPQRPPSGIIIPGMGGPR